jgi:hypothetical protein
MSGERFVAGDFVAVQPAIHPPFRLIWLLHFATG